MNRKIRIVVLGLGGVGGYLGGLLARAYAKGDKYEIVFIARPSTEAIINEKGLQVMTLSENFTVFPDVVASTAKGISEADIVICSVKSYDLQESLSNIANIIGPQTLILPLLNGVNNTDIIQQMFPEAMVAEGCIYIVSRRESAGIIKMSGTSHVLYFGSSTIPANVLAGLNDCLKGAGINSSIPENITQTIWEKFVFISAIATLTSCADKSIGALLENNVLKNQLIGLLSEAIAIAKGLSIPLPDDMIDRAIKKMEQQPYDTTSSMHSDFKNGGKTEYLSLTGYIVEQGLKLHIPTPFYDVMLDVLKNKTAAH
ncbi:MAG: 2-dehydropantoate 2-reductase [Bacteroidota bacterium]